LSTLLTLPVLTFLMAKLRDFYGKDAQAWANAQRKLFRLVRSRALRFTKSNSPPLLVAIAKVNGDAVHEQEQSEQNDERCSSVSVKFGLRAGDPVVGLNWQDGEWVKG